MNTSGQHSGDLVPKKGKSRHLTAPKQGDLTPEAADRILRPERSTPSSQASAGREDAEDPISTGRGGLEIFFYGIMLLFVVGYQLFNYLDRESDGRLMEGPTVVGISVDDQARGETYRVDGDRLEKPDCDEGEANIEVSAASVDGTVVGHLRLTAVSDNGEWQIESSALPFGGARVAVDATITCENGS